MDDKPKHSPIGASSMYRWGKCPGSVKACEGKTQTQSVYAIEGTAAHEFIGFNLDKSISTLKPIREVIKEMTDAVLVYADYVWSRIEGFDHKVHIEHGFDMSDIFPRLYGTADCVIYDRGKRLLEVIDYKHGQGMVVEVEGNEQLLYYALGALHTLGYPCREVKLTIVQPRAYHPAGPIRSWTVPLMYFIDFKADVIEKAKATEKKNAPRVAGGHCVFCLDKADCPTKAAMPLAEAKKEFKYYSDPKNDFVNVGDKNIFD